MGFGWSVLLHGRTAGRPSEWEGVDIGGTLLAILRAILLRNRDIYMNRISCIVLVVTLILLVTGCGSEPETAERPQSPDTSAQSSEVQRAPETSSPVVDDGVLFFGDSITAGLGVSADQAFPALIQEKIDSLGWSFEVVPAGVSGETSAGGLRRISWVMHEGIEVMVLELGGNDGLRGVPVQATRNNLSAIIDSARAVDSSVRILLTGMQVPPNLGSKYTQAFKNIYPELASEQNVELIPFLLKGVGGNPEFNQPDGIHPNAKGHRKLAETVWKHLKPILQDLRSQTST